MRHKRPSLAILLVLAFFVLVRLASAVAAQIIEPGEVFILRQGESARLGQEGPEIGIERFHNSPCPSHVRCIWSGVGIAFHWSFHEETLRGVDLVRAFGYELGIIETDYESYVRLVARKRDGPE